MSTDLKNLGNKTKNQLMEMVKKLAAENALLMEVHVFMESTNKRLDKLEREQNMSLQYTRRDTIEITGIPENVVSQKLEEEVLKIYKKAGVQIHGKSLDPSDIQACHRIGKKYITICKFVNRKFAREGLVCGRNLKGTDIYGASPVYINSSFCPEFKFLNFLIRKAKSRGDIFLWKVRNGVNLIQVNEGGKFVEVAHKNDLIELNLLESE